MRSRGAFTVVIAGGGVAAIEAALALRELGQERVSVEILGSDPRFWYRPVAVAEPFGLGEVRHFELPGLAGAAGATFTLATLASVDAREHVVHTSAAAALPYDALLIACGAVPKPAVPGALTFRGPADTERVRELLAEIEAGEVRRVAFAVPWGAAWVLPAYELTLMTAAWLAARDIRDVELALVTPEEEPLQLFGSAVSEAVRELLDERRVALHTRVYPGEAREGELGLVPDGSIAAERVVALPRLHGQRIDGVPQTIDGFVPVDPHGRIIGVDDVFAAGDITSYPVKQGGIAAQQAEAAAEAIAALAGVALAPRPFQPVLRGLLLTGRAPRYLRRNLMDPEDFSGASEAPLWWPPTKIVGRRLAPFLAELGGVEVPAESPSADALPVEVELGARDVERLAAHRFYPPLDQAAQVERGEGSARTVGDVMSAEPLVAVSEDTVAEVAARMTERDVGGVLVTDSGRLVGILTSSDLLRAWVTHGGLGTAPVRAWMTVDPVAVNTVTTLHEAILLMAEYGVHHLPVVEGGRPVGMVGLGDVARSALAESRPAIGLGF